MNVNKICNVEDWALLAEEMQRVLGHIPTRLQRKAWEIAMTVTAFRQHEAIQPGAQVLGVGAGVEPTIFYLCNEDCKVTATDLYRKAGAWSATAQAAMLTNPEACAPFPFKKENLTVLHMDGRKLDFPDDTFDMVFSCSSIEHFGSLDDVAQTMREIARVLKPGGIVSLTTEYQVGGEATGDGWPGVLVFNKETLDQYVIKPSGLKRASKADYQVSEATLATETSLAELVRIYTANEPTDLPDVVLEHIGYVFTSIQVTLVKPRKRA